MNSIRPLATITLLACAGVFLYMKINESEPVLPEELGEWSNTLELDQDLGADPATDFGGDSFDSPAPYSSAPQAAGPAGGAAPSWSPPPAAETSPTAAPAAAEAALETDAALAAQSPLTSDGVASPEIPEMPDLPPLGGDPGAEAPLPSDSAAAAAPQGTEQANQSTPESDYRAAGGAAAPDTPSSVSGAGTRSKYETARVAIQAALERGELAKALQLTTEWYGDPSLTPPQTAEVETLLSQLAGTVVYSTQPVLSPPYIVRAGDTLETIAEKYDVPWQLLAKINGVAQPNALQPGQELKVVKGPFTALVDLSRRELTLMLDRHYAGRFSIEFDPQLNVEEGSWSVDQKLVTPTGPGLYGSPSGGKEDRSLVLSNLSQPGGQVAVLRGPKTADPIAAAPGERVIRLPGTEVEDVYDILSVGSKVIIRR